jgi:hypothetical protein
MVGFAREFPPRPLRPDESAALSYLLAADFPGAEDLRRQAEVVSVVGDLGDCCPTIEFRVDADAAPQATVAEPVPVEARSRRGPARELLLFVRDGWLTSLELVHYEEEPGPERFPDPAEFGPPTWDPETYARASAHLLDE